eukprot:m.81434 g.81434  ORF g.81434 m.81434 type:complete len:91 (+) comp14572_c0_seq1:2093-2365(+)
MSRDAMLSTRIPSLIFPVAPAGLDGLRFFIKMAAASSSVACSNSNPNVSSVCRRMTTSRSLELLITLATLEYTPVQSLLTNVFLGTNSNF